MDSEPDNIDAVEPHPERWAATSPVFIEALAHHLDTTKLDVCEHLESMANHNQMGDAFAVMTILDELVMTG